VEALKEKLAELQQEKADQNTRIAALGHKIEKLIHDQESEH